MNQSELVPLLRQRLTKEQEEIASQVLLGNADHETYKYKCGMLAGITLSLEAIKDTVRSLNDPKSVYS